MESLVQHATQHVPRCLDGVTAVPVDEATGDDTVIFILSSNDRRQAKILGYDLRRYNPDYQGELFFISPLFVQWEGETRRVLIFDSAVHGYHGEIEESAKLRGDGEPETFRCPRCSGELFTPKVEFKYWDAVYDLWEDEPDLDIQNYFCEFTLHGTCCGCSQEVLVTSLEKV